MTYAEALEYIHGVNSAFCKPGLERVSALCSAIGNPERKLKFIHIGGTNGKGSTSCMLAQVLKEAGYRVGLYTSPYIYRFNERIAVDGKPIADEDLARLTEWMVPIVEKQSDRPTEFELITAIAMQYFLEKECDVVVLEVGLGGRFDSTNIIDPPLLSIITGISLDHTALLGNTVEKIAFEKAGIIKMGRPVLYGGRDKNAEAVIENVANERGSAFHRVDHSKIRDTSLTLSGGRLTYGEWNSVDISLLGTYQVYNAACVLEAINILRKEGLNLDTGAVYRGMKAARWRARFEIISRDPTVIFDGAHNPEGIDAAVDGIREYYRDERIIAISGVLADKDYRAVARSISRVASSAYTITPDNPRALSAKDYAAVLCENGVDARPTESVDEAVRLATDRAVREGKAVFCLGSLYTYSAVIDAINKYTEK